MKYNTILLDFDDTLVDFYDAEDKAQYGQTLSSLPNSRRLSIFKQINQAHWEAFKRIN